MLTTLRRGRMSLFFFSFEDPALWFILRATRWRWNPKRKSIVDRHVGSELNPAQPKISYCYVSRFFSYNVFSFLAFRIRLQCFLDLRLAWARAISLCEITHPLHGVRRLSGELLCELLFFSHIFSAFRDSFFLFRKRDTRRYEQYIFGTRSTWNRGNTSRLVWKCQPNSMIGFPNRTYICDGI